MGGGGSKRKMNGAFWRTLAAFYLHYFRYKMSNVWAHVTPPPPDVVPYISKSIRAQNIEAAAHFGTPTPFKTTLSENWESLKLSRRKLGIG